MATCRNMISLHNSSLSVPSHTYFLRVSKTECYDFHFFYLQLTLQKKTLNAELDSCLPPAPLVWAISLNSVFRILPDAALTQDSLLTFGPWAGFGCLPLGGCEWQRKLVKGKLSHLVHKSYLICESCWDVNASYIVFVKVIFQFSRLYERCSATLPICVNPHVPALSPVWNILPFAFCCWSKCVVWYPCWIFCCLMYCVWGFFS